MLLRRRFRFRVAGLGAGLCLAVLASFLLASCSSRSSGRAEHALLVRVTERDFRITVAPARIRAGTVRLVLQNRGPDTHELIMVRHSPGRLPLRSDGLTVNEEVLEQATAGTAEGQAPGVAHELLLHLKPGRYELFCNMAGHYLGGMSAEFTVE
jgi:hypothetical protein